MSTYTQTDGAADGTQYFQNVEISPDTLADGSLLTRLDQARYPQLGDDEGAQAGGVTPSVVVTASDDAPVHATSVTLTARVTSVSIVGTYPSGTVTFKDGATTLGTGVLVAGVATLVVAGGFTAATHHITAVYPGDGLFDTKTSAIHDVVAS
jgi:hypothetical protein